MTRVTRCPAVTVVLAAVLCAAFAGCRTKARKDPPMPDSFRLVYSQDFRDQAAASDFVVSDPDAWSVETAGELGWLELEGASDYEPPHRSPLSIALVVGPRVGSFVLEADLEQTGREYGHRDLCLFFGVQDPEHYYYAHLATRADENAHQIFLVDGAARRPVTSARTYGVDWADRPWHRVLLVRDLESEFVRVYFDDDPDPVLQARDVTFGAGWIGFGSFDDVGRFARVRLWSDELEVRSPGFFRPLEVGG